MLTERQKKLELIVNEIDETCGFGNGYVDENTDVDKFIEEFIYKFTEDYNLKDFFEIITEDSGKSYMERFNEI